MGKTALSASESAHLRDMSQLWSSPNPYPVATPIAEHPTKRRAHGCFNCREKKRTFDVLNARTYVFECFHGVRHTTRRHIIISWGCQLLPPNGFQTARADYLTLISLRETLFIAHSSSPIHPGNNAPARMVSRAVTEIHSSWRTDEIRNQS